MNQLHSDSDSMAAGLEGNVENEDRITKINTSLQGLFGAQFEILIGKTSWKRNVLCGFLQLDQHFGSTFFLQS